MATKKRGVTPSYETALSLEPRATLSEETGAPFSRQRVNEVLTTDCYDSGPSHPWEFRFGTKRRALLDGDKAARRDWAPRLLSEGHTAVWYHDNVVWVDILREGHPRLPSKGTRPGDGGEEQKEAAHQSWLRRIVCELWWLLDRR